MDSVTKAQEKETVFSNKQTRNNNQFNAATIRNRVEDDKRQKEGPSGKQEVKKMRRKNERMKLAPYAGPTYSLTSCPRLQKRHGKRKRE